MVETAVGIIFVAIVWWLIDTNIRYAPKQYKDENNV